MKFEWDKQKNRINEAKHGIDFETATHLWNDKSRVEIHTKFPDENRNIIIGKLEEKLWAAIFTLRRDTIRIISVRRARKKEASLYEEEKIS